MSVTQNRFGKDEEPIEETVLSIEEIPREGLPSRFKIKISDREFSLDKVEELAQNMLIGVQQFRSAQAADMQLDDIVKRRNLPLEKK